MPPINTSPFSEIPSLPFTPLNSHTSQIKRSDLAIEKAPHSNPTAFTLGDKGNVFFTSVYVRRRMKKRKGRCKFDSLPRMDSASDSLGGRPQSESD